MERGSTLEIHPHRQIRSFNGPTILTMAHQMQPEITRAKPLPVFPVQYLVALYLWEIGGRAFSIRVAPGLLVISILLVYLRSIRPLPQPAEYISLQCRE